MRIHKALADTEPSRAFWRRVNIKIISFQMIYNIMLFFVCKSVDDFIS